MIRKPILLMMLLLAVSCVREEAPTDPVKEDNLVTIRVTIPEDPYTKVSFTPDGNTLKLSWQDGDNIRVISGENSQVFTISKIISDHVAEFTGAAVAGSTFDILFPGTYESVAAAEADTSTPTQTGNGSAEHLRFRALLSGVNAYEEFAFTSAWASAHGGSLKLAPAVKMQLTLPGGVTTVKKAGITLGGTNYTLPLSGVDVSASAQVLTAYMMLPWENIALPDGTKIPVYVMDTDNEAYSAMLSVSGDKTILCGKVNTFKNITLNLGDFVAGDGTEENPYLIANCRHLSNMGEIYSSAADDADFKYWFRLLEDIDASDIANWSPINRSGSTYKRAVDFDGDGHTIFHLTSSSDYTGFAGVLNGKIHDVTFSNASITGTKKSGVVAGFLGTADIYGSCENVTVTNSEITCDQAVGGFAGHVKTPLAVTNCHVINTTINAKNPAGGFCGMADLNGYEVPCVFTGCTVEGVTLNQNRASASSTCYTGGFVGNTAQAVSFIDCHVINTTVKATGAAIECVGGFVGGTTYAGANFQGCTVDDETTVTAKANNIGGFVGYAYVSDSYKGCTSSATVSNSANGTKTGGFAGSASGGASFTGCSADGNVTAAKADLGGFAGYVQNASFTDCYYQNGTITSSVSAADAYVGGFAGYATSGALFRGCYAKNATVSATAGNRVGGFIGQNGTSTNRGASNISITRCYVSGTSISGRTNTGGFVGVQYDNIVRCYVSAGGVTANGSNCGGFTGYLQSGDVSFCYTTASVSGGTNSEIGGFVGIVKDDASAFNCYASGAQSGSGDNRGAFVGRCDNNSSYFNACIGWNASLAFAGLNTAGASVDNCYAGTSGTIKDKAVEQSWSSISWNLEGSAPVLKDKDSRIPAIFVGDSITWQWAGNGTTKAKSAIKIPIDPLPSYMTENGDNVTIVFHPGFFAGNGYIDKGISGQNTTQMRTRFAKDVLALEPQVVVIMGGTNDLAQGVTKETIVENISAMADAAVAAGIRVILCTVTPCNDTYSRLNDPKTKGAHIITLNTMLKAVADANGYEWCNYWSALVNPEDDLSLAPEYRLYDNLHPGPDGYDVMEPIIHPIIQRLIADGDASGSGTLQDLTVNDLIDEI